MNKTITRILITLSSFVILYLGVVLIASVNQVAAASDRIYLGLGQIVFWLLLSAFVVLFASPVVLYFRLPKPLIPPTNGNEADHEVFLERLRVRLQKNPHLKGSLLENTDQIPTALAKLGLDADRVVRNTASAVFVSTAVMQNGRLDALIVLVTQFRMVWKIACIYYQRPSPRQMLYLYSNVGATALLADNIQDIDFSELATPLVTAVIPSLNGAIPGLQGVAALLVNSIANGSANAFLTLRVGIVAKRYCESLARPDRQTVRRSATIAALALVGGIAKENGSRIVKSAWTSIRGATGSIVLSAVDGVKSASNKVVDTTASTAKSLGGGVVSGTRGVMSVTNKVVGTTTSTAKAVGRAIARGTRTTRLLGRHNGGNPKPE